MQCGNCGYVGREKTRFCVLLRPAVRTRTVGRRATASASRTAAVIGPAAVGHTASRVAAARTALGTPATSAADVESAPAEPVFAAGFARGKPVRTVRREPVRAASAQPWGTAPAPPPPGYGYPGQPVRTNGLAIASLVVSLVGCLCGVGAILGIIFGFVARSQIRQSNGTQTGEGLALAGIIVGFVTLALVIVWFVLIAVSGSSSNT